MSLPVSVPYAFANATTTQNLSSLDSNFNALANGLNGLANGSSQISVSSISATGTANSNTYLRGDGAWATVSGGGSDVTYANVTVTQNLVPPSSFLRNRIINGDMRIDQRNAGASVTATTADPYTLDRWQTSVSQSSKFSIQQNAGSVTPPAGFSNYAGITSLAATSLGAGDYFGFRQFIEGFNTADLAWGTANAQTVTLSFWVRSSLTGAFGGSIKNNGNARSYPFSYTISSANTWEQKTITIPGDTSGTWLTNNGIGICVTFGLGVGSTYSGTAGAWAAANYWSTTGATSVVGTNGATFYITGVQLEVGTIATPFERRLYGQELALCQRYYASNIGPVIVGNQTGSTVNCYGGTSIPVTMRATPTLTGAGAIVSSVNYISVAISTAAFSSASSGNITASAEL